MTPRSMKYSISDSAQSEKSELVKSGDYWSIGHESPLYERARRVIFYGMLFTGLPCSFISSYFFEHFRGVSSVEFLKKALTSELGLISARFTLLEEIPGQSGYSYIGSSLSAVLFGVLWGMILSLKYIRLVEGPGLASETDWKTWLKVSLSFSFCLAATYFTLIMDLSSFANPHLPRMVFVFFWPVYPGLAVLSGQFPISGGVLVFVFVSTRALKYVRRIRND